MISRGSVNGAGMFCAASIRRFIVPGQDRNVLSDPEKVANE